jgi:glycine hydroxymethyltransferase
MDEADMSTIAALIGRAVRDADGTAAADIAADVTSLVAAKPAYAS